jgi:hypothetical protein
VPVHVIVCRAAIIGTAILGLGLDLAPR